MSNKSAILRNIQNGDLYRHIENDTYKNLRTLSIGTIEPELASRVLKVNVNASFLINEYEILELMIHRLHIRLDVNNL